MRFIRTFFRFIWNTLRFFHTLVFGLVAMVIVAVLFLGPFRKEAIVVPDGAALILTLDGAVVEQLTEVDPFAAATGGPSALPQEVLLADVETAIARAAKDDRIEMLVLALDDFAGAGPATLHELAAAVDAFKESGKTVAAYGDSYSQAQYLLASHADQVFLNPGGAVAIFGYGVYPLYFRAALEKLELDTHVFRVGTYKSAVEPYIRDDMSDDDKEAMMGFLSVLWDSYVGGVAAQRGDRGANISGRFENLPDLLRAADGDTARLAMATGLVDGLKTRDQMVDWLQEKLGAGQGGDAYPRIAMDRYLAATKKLRIGHGKNRIAVIYAVGEIVDGEAPTGTAGGDTVAGLIRKARRDDDVKAIVLRVDSPGGSAFASEIIRRELERAQADGKPVIASMGSLAASGGYWISATADEIWAEPTTITGSIGIFGVFMTGQDSLDKIGIHSDGVGTTDLAGSLSLARPLNPLLADIVQQSIEKGYRQFIALVAKGRGMTPEAVDAIGQGRVWAGTTAKELGLVDAFGDLEDAVAAAAAKAGLEQYEKVVFEVPLSPTEQFIRELLENLDAAAPGLLRRPASLEAVVLGQLRGALAPMAHWNDPNHAYALCLECAAMKAPTRP